jgi:DNA invertase Pin-like site-specific DNA recombinase
VARVGAWHLSFKAEGVALHMIDLGGDVCGNGISKLVFTILSAVAEIVRDRIRPPRLARRLWRRQATLWL